MFKLVGNVVFKFIFLISICLFCLSNFCYAQSYKEALKLAIDNSRELAIQNERILEANATEQFTRADRNINISAYTQLGFNASRSDDINTQASTSSLYLAADKLLYDFGHLKHQESSNRYNTLAQEKGLENLKQTVILNASTLYIDYFTILRNIEIRKNSVKILERQLRGANLRYQVGEGTITDIALAESRLSSAKTGLILAQNSLDANAFNFERVFGFKPTGAMEIISIDQFDLPFSMSEAVSSAGEENPSILIQKLLTQSEIESYEAVKKQYKPTVSVGLNLSSQFNHQNDTLFDGNGNSVNLLLKYAVPLSTGGKRSSSRAIALSRLNARKILSYEIESTILMDVKIAWNNLQVSLNVIENVQTGVTSAQTALKGTIKERDAGLRPELDVLNAEQELLERELGLVDAERQIIISTLSLYAAMGLLKNII